LLEKRKEYYVFFSEVTSAERFTNSRITDAARHAVNGGVRSAIKNDAQVKPSDPKKASVMKVAKLFPHDGPLLDFFEAPSPHVKQTFSPFRRMPLHTKQRVMAN
jgi:hypothetical protein